MERLEKLMIEIMDLKLEMQGAEDERDFNKYAFLKNKQSKLFKELNEIKDEIGC